MSTLDPVADNDLLTEMIRLGEGARAAAQALGQVTTEAKNNALGAAAASLRAETSALLAANRKDMEAAKANGISDAMLDRLMLDEGRVESMAAGLEAIAGLADPVGEVLAEWVRPNGLRIARVRVPLGVIGIIYEARPNVTADAGGLCLKSGNAAILRGGSESFHSTAAIMGCLQHGRRMAALPGASARVRAAGCRRRRVFQRQRSGHV